jgi:hypothetical protein
LQGEVGVVVVVGVVRVGVTVEVASAMVGAEVAVQVRVMEVAAAVRVVAVKVMAVEEVAVMVVGVVVLVDLLYQWEETVGMVEWLEAILAAEVMVQVLVAADVQEKAVGGATVLGMAKV